MSCNARWTSATYIKEHCFNEPATRMANALVRYSPGKTLVRSPEKPDPVCNDELESLICDCVDLLLPTLPPEQARVVRAIDMEGASPQSVADTVGVKLNEVTTYLVLGRQCLKDRFGDMHMICPQHGLAGCNCHLKGDPET